MPVDHANCKVLLHFNGYNGSTGIDDYAPTSSIKQWTAAGSACIKTAIKQFGRGSLFLDGVNSYVYTADHGDFTIGTGSFTFDFNIRFLSFPEYTEYCIFNKYQDASNYWYFSLRDAGTKTWRFKYVEGGTTIFDIEFPAATLSLGTWYHVALIRNGTALHCYQGGVDLGGETCSTELVDFTGSFEVGRFGNGSKYSACYLDEFHFVTAAIYTAAFTPPESAYRASGVDDEYTAALLHFNGADGGTTFTDQLGLSWTRVGTPTTSTTEKALGSASMTVNGGTQRGITSPALSASTRLHSLFRDKFTFDFWTRFVALPSAGNIHYFASWNNYAVTLGIYNVSGTYKIRVNANAQTLWTWDTPATDTWYHIALVKNAGNVTIYVDGVSIGTNAVTITSYDTVGEYSALTSIGPAYLNHTLSGYIDELRLSNDVERWTENFTPDSVNEYGTTFYSETVAFGAKAQIVFDTLWDDAPFGAAAAADFTGQYYYEKSHDESAAAAADFTGQYYYEKSHDESAAADMKFSAGYYMGFGALADATVEFDAIYVKYVGFSGEIPFPTLSSSTGMNAWTDPEMIMPFPTLETEIGKSMEANIPFPVLSATGSPSISANLSAVIRGILLGASATIPITATLSYEMSDWITVSGTAYSNEEGLLSYTLKLPTLFSHGRSRSLYSPDGTPMDFSDYVLRYYRP